mgnify:CR=1 FL=1
MENKVNRFWLYLLEKEKKVLTKEEVNEKYNKFQNMWKDKKKILKKYLIV